MSNPPQRDGRPASGHGLAGRLRTLREATLPKVSQTAAGRAIRASQNKISRAESGQWVLTPEEVRTLARLYGATAAEVRTLVGWAKALQASTTSARVILERGALFDERVRLLEEGAAVVRSYQPTIVLGVMQTEAVAAAALRGDAERVRTRLDRNAQLLDDDGRRWLLIQTEGSLLMNVAGSAAMAEQADALIAVSRRPNVDLRIITSAEVVPPGRIVGHGFHVYDAQAALVGTRSGSTITTDEADVRDYLDTFDALADLALRGDDARATLGRIAARYRERIR